jgi:hypothetical protein avisC_12452
MSTLALEIRKHRNSKLPFLVLGLALFETAWLAAAILVQASRSPQGIQELKTFSLYNYLNMQSLLLGPTIAFLASRIAGVDQEERMGQVFRALGESPRRQFLTKLALLTGLGTLISMIMLFSAAFTGSKAGLLDSPSYASTFWVIIALTLVSVIAISAVQLALSNLFEQPSAGVIIGITGTLITCFLPYLNISMLGWISPWGLTVAGTPYALITPENSSGTDFTLMSNPWLLVAIAAIIALAWTFASAWLVIRKEEKA